MSAYYKEPRRDWRKFGMFAASIGFILFVALATWAVLNTGSEDSLTVPSATTSDSNVEPGIIAQFDRAGNPLAGQQDQPAVAGDSTSEPAAAEPAVEKTLQLNLAADWQLTSEQTAANPCLPEKTQTVSTYTRGSTTLTVYEDGAITGCNGETVPDTLVLYQNAAAGGITLARSEAYEQCSKEANPACPRGDGKLTLFVQNIDSSTGGEVAHPDTGATYAFQIDETAIQADFSTQVDQMLDILQNVTVE